MVESRQNFTTLFVQNFMKNKIQPLLEQQNNLKHVRIRHPENQEVVSQRVEGMSQPPLAAQTQQQDGAQRVFKFLSNIDIKAIDRSVDYAELLQLM